MQTPITKLRTAYKIGFASALSFDTISAYIEAANYSFEGNVPGRIKKGFIRGYADGRKWFSIVRRGGFDSQQQGK